MGLLDFFGGGTPAVKAQRLKAKATQKYGDAATRQKALQQLSELKHADAVPVLMNRFTFNVDPQTTDAEEKEHVFQAICDLEKDCVLPVKAFLTRSDTASSWALKILDAVLNPDEVMQIVTDELQRLGANYTRDPEKKEVLIRFLDAKQDERIGPVLVPFLNDMSDDVKMAALKTLASLKYEPARETLLTLLTTDETARRVQTACIATLVETGFTVQGFREKVEAKLTEGYFVDKAGAVKKRGS
jgi:F0F1-type ATP synthase delta subunit